jgi:N6-L-threonylcarbamoyladenine synthase
VIDRLARSGINTELRFPRSALQGTHDFSFSGVKTAVYYHVQKYGKEKGFDAAKVAYAFQESVVGVLVEKSLMACRMRDVHTLLVGGGVAANSALREQLTSRAKEFNIDVRFPPMAFCLDNAAMIAGLGYYLRLR